MAEGNRQNGTTTAVTAVVFAELAVAIDGAVRFVQIVFSRGLVVAAGYFIGRARAS